MDRSPATTVLEEAAAALPAVRAAAMANALADVRQYRRGRDGVWCTAWDQFLTKSAGRDVPAPRPASEPLPLRTGEDLDA